MLVCTSATTLPTVIVSAAITHSTIVQCAPTGPRWTRKMRRKPAKAASFTPTAMNAVTGVGAPS